MTPGLRVLVVEDDEMVSNLLQDVLDEDYEVRCVAKAEEAVAEIARRRQRVAWVGSLDALNPTRVPGHAIRTYSGRPSSSMRFSTVAAMATSVACRPSVRERSSSAVKKSDSDGALQISRSAEPFHFAGLARPNGQSLENWQTGATRHLADGLRATAC